MTGSCDQPKLVARKIGQKEEGSQVTFLTGFENSLTPSVNFLSGTQEKSSKGNSKINMPGIRRSVTKELLPRRDGAC